MTVQISKRDLIIPILRAARSRPGAFASAADLVRALQEEFGPEGQDAELTAGAQETYFAYRIRNLIADPDNGMFAKGYAELSGDGVQVTPKGVEFVDQLP